MNRLSALIFALLFALASAGCAIVEVGVRNPVVGLETVAVAPFFNLSQERTVDGREFGLAYYSELQKIPGFEVLPVGVTERAMVENGITLAGPEDAVRLARILDVDAVVVGAVTDYDPYNPRIGLKVAWYSPRQWLFLPNEDPNVPFFKRSADAPVKHPGRPKYGTPRAQSPDDFSRRSGNDPAVVIGDEYWVSAGFEKGPLESASSEAVLSRIQPYLPEGTSLLVPAGDASFPSLPEPARISVTQPVKNHQPEKILRLDYEEPSESTESVWPVPAPAAEEVDEILPVQGTSVAPPAPFPQLGSQTPSAPAASAPSAGDNPFNRHESAPQRSAGGGQASGQPGTSTIDSSTMPPASRTASADPQSPDSAMTESQSVVPSPGPTGPPVPSGTSGENLGSPVMTTPLFPIPAPVTEPLPVRPPGTAVPGFVIDEQVVMAPADFEPTEPLMAYVRLFDATDRRLIARLSDYLELTGQLRSGDLEAYMKRSEFFRKFTAHVMISEMLQLHGGEARRQLVLKPRRYR